MGLILLHGQYFKLCLVKYVFTAKLFSFLRSKDENVEFLGKLNDCQLLKEESLVQNVNI
jgi:hypothetical protein